MDRRKIKLPDPMPTDPEDAHDMVYDMLKEKDHHEPYCVSKYRTPGSRAWASTDKWLQNHAGQEIEVDYLKG